MFDFDASKLLIVGAIALIFIPPKDLPRVLRQVGQFVGKMRRMANEFQGQFMEAMREADMADLRQEARKLAEAAKVDVGLNAVADLKNHLTGAIEGEPLTVETTPSPLDPVPAASTEGNAVEASAAAESVTVTGAPALGTVHTEAGGTARRVAPATEASVASSA